MEWLGAGTVLPILPLYLGRQGASDLVIGLAMASFFAAGVIVQYPVGRLSDKIGQTSVLVAALLCFGLASVGYLLPVGPWAEIGLRALQGAGAGAAEVAALALVGRCVPEQRRGSAYGAIFGAQLAALAVGPLLGSIVGIDHMGLLFVGGAIAAGLACIPVLRAAASMPPVSGPGDGVPAVRVKVRSIRALQGCFVVALIAGLTTGIYESCWTLLLEARGASSFEIGLSWSLFCIPFVAMSVPAGRLADRLDRRWLVVVSLLISILLLFVYPYLNSIAAIIILGGSEGIGVAIAYPAAQSLLSQLAPPGQEGQTQGLFSSLQTAAIAVSAAAGGALFSLADWAPFVVVGIAAGLLLALVPPIWRGVPGRVPALASTPVPLG
jgi:MFS family permease